jgi:hypothetical protein
MNYYTVTQVCWVAGILQPGEIKISVPYYQNQIVLNQGTIFLLWHLGFCRCFPQHKPFFCFHVNRGCLYG